MKKVICFIGMVWCMACGKDDPQPPGVVALVFPESDSECTTGVPLNEVSTEVEFIWERASNTRSYELEVVNLENNIEQRLTTTQLRATLPLRRGTPYAWKVVSENANGRTESASWRFYNAGSELYYAPFPADLLAPTSGASVQRDASGAVELRWDGADVDNDLDSFQVYLDTQNPPANLAGNTGSGTRSLKVGVDSGQVYYWSVTSTDRRGNQSNSGVFSFKTL